MAAYERRGTAVASLAASYVLRGSARIDLCQSPYNAVVGADITTALQAALNYIATNCPNGGEIYFSEPGTYLINGASQTGTAQGYSYAGQVLIPAVSLATSRPIVIRGCIRSSGGGQSTGAPNGVVLLSNATTGYVFDIVPSFTEFGCPWTGVMPIFEDIVIRNAIDNPTAGGINLLCTQRAKLERVQIDTPNSFIAPVAGTLEALVLPQIYCNGDVTVRDATIRGYPVGVRLGEHGVFDNVDVAYCMTAFKGGGASHANWFGYVDVEECPTIFDGGSAPAFGAPAPVAGSTIVGALDFENGNTGSLKPVAFVNDSAANPIVGKLDTYGTVSGSHPIVGGRSLDLIPVNFTPTQGPKQRGAGWMESHPYDNFKRQIDLSGAGAPGQCAPSLHPWRVEAGSFAVTAASGLKGLTGDDRCFVPVYKAGNFSQLAGAALSRMVTLKCNVAAAGTIRLYACAPFAGPGSANGALSALEVKITQGAALTLRANNTNITSAGATVTTGAHTVQIAVYHNAAGYPYAAKVYLDGALVMTCGIPTASSALGNSSPSTWPYYEDGIRMGDTTSSVQLFAVQDINPELTYVESGTATLAAGTVTVTNSRITANSVIRYWRTTAGGTLGQLSLALTAGTSFTVNSSNGTDTSTIYYEVVSY